MIKSVQKAIQILQILSDGQNEPVPLSEIAERAGLNKSTCAHLLETMCESGMAERISRQEGYRVGILAYYITRHGRYHQELVEICNPVMCWLRKKTNHSVVLVMLRSHKKAIIHWVCGINKFPGNYGNMYYESQYRYSTSHAILAAMSDMERSEFYLENGYPTRDEWPKLYAPEGEKAAYDEINRRGYEIFRYPFETPGQVVVGMATALRNREKVVAALGIALPNEYGTYTMEDGQPWHLTQEEEASIARYLCAATKEINRRLQF